MGFSLEEKIAEVENAAVAASWRKPESIVIDRPDWFQITTPSSKQYWMNGVQRSILAAGDAPRVVAETVAGYEAAGAKFRWIVGPSARPAELPGLLLAHGMKEHHEGLGMVAEVDRLRIEASAGVTVERVTASSIDDYVKACVAGWGNTADGGREIQADMNRCLRDPSHRTQYYLARVDGRPAASGALLPLARSGYLMASSVVPEFRRRGVYRSLVAARLAELRTLRIPLVTIQAMAETSAPICARLGFETVCEIRVFHSK